MSEAFHAAYGAPVMLFALLPGMAMNFLSAEGSFQPGIEVTARQLLRIGIALLGLRITLAQVAALGWGRLALVVLSVVLTIGVSIAAARLLGFRGLFGLLTGGATAICGASAALGLSATLPNHPMKDKATLFTVIGVSALSTLAMVAYPTLARALGLDEQQAGMFLGATIHDVAQGVGAGYSLSSHTGDVATLVKLMLVAMLRPVPSACRCCRGSPWRSRSWWRSTAQGGCRARCKPRATTFRAGAWLPRSPASA